MKELALFFIAGVVLIFLGYRVSNTKKLLGGVLFFLGLLILLWAILIFIFATGVPS